MDGVIAYFFGGPRDGEVLAVEGAPPEVCFPSLAEPVARGVENPDEFVSYRTVCYRRRGSALGGAAFYDWMNG